MIGTLIKWALIALGLYIVIIIATGALTMYTKTLDVYQPTCCQEARKLPAEDAFKQYR